MIKGMAQIRALPAHTVQQVPGPGPHLSSGAGCHPSAGRLSSLLHASLLCETGSRCFFILAFPKAEVVGAAALRGKTPEPPPHGAHVKLHPH